MAVLKSPGGCGAISVAGVEYSIDETTGLVEVDDKHVSALCLMGFVVSGDEEPAPADPHGVAFEESAKPKRTRSRRKK